MRFEAQYDGQTPPPRIPRAVWLMCQAIVCSTRGARYWLRWARSRYSGLPLARLRDAALLPQPDGTCRFDFGDMNARRIFAIGLFHLRCSSTQTARRVFGSRSRRSGRVVWGISKAAISKAVTPADRRSRPWHRNTLGGKTDDWDGDFRRLELAGFFERKRLPIARVKPWEIGNKSGQVITRYWIPCVPTLDRADERKRRTDPPERFGGEVDASTRFWAEHNLGWQVCDEVPIRTTRARVASSSPPPL